MSRLRLSFFLALVLSGLLAVPPARAQPNEKADAALKPLEARLGETGADREKLRQDLLAFRRTNPGTAQAVRAAELLQQLPSPLDKLDAQAIPPLDRFDWQPKELVAVLGEHRGRHGQAVTCVTYSPDGKTVASGGANGLVRLWDSATLRQKGPSLGTGSGTLCLAWARDGKWLAAGNAGGAIYLWDVSGPEPKAGPVIQAGTSPIYSVAFSSGGKSLAAGSLDTIVRLYDLTGPEPKEKIQLTGHQKEVMAVAFAPDGRALVSGSLDGTIRLWDPTGDQAKERTTIEAHPKDVTALAFSPAEARTLASASNDGSIKLWDLSTPTPKQRAELKTQAGAVSTLAFTISGKTLASGHGDGTIRLWDALLVVPKEKAVLEGHAGAAPAVAFAPDGQTLASGSGDWTVRLWNLTTTPKPKQRFEPEGHLSHAYAVAFAPDDQTLATGSYDRGVRLWSPVTGGKLKDRSLLKGDNIPIYALSFAPDGKMLAAGGAGVVVRIWDPVAGRELRSLKGNPGQVSALAFGPDSRRLLAASGKSVMVWDALARDLIRSLDGHTTPVTSVAFSPDGRRILSGSGTYKYENGKIVVKDGKYVYEDCTARLWAGDNGKELKAWDQHPLPVSSVAFTPDNRLALSGAGDAAVRRWDVSLADPKEEVAFRGSSGAADALFFSPDGKMLATVGLDYRLTVWDPVAGKALRQWALPENLGGIGFASDSRHLAVGLGTGPVYVLRLAAPGEMVK
jgi:WD40 repeat protein